MFPGRWEPRLGREADYARAKRLLDIGRHPTYIGRGQYQPNAARGGVTFAVIDGTDAAIAIVNARRSVLLALNVHPDRRSQGLGAEFLAYLAPNWARVIEQRVAWFEAQGFTAVGESKQGRRYRTQIMVRTTLIDLSGRLAGRLDAEADRVQAPHPGVEAA